jgi:hypothetical protein
MPPHIFVQSSSLSDWKEISHAGQARAVYLKAEKSINLPPLDSINQRQMSGR